MVCSYPSTPHSRHAPSALVPAYTVDSMLSITTTVMGEVDETESNICPVYMVYTLTVMSMLLVMTLAPCPTLTPVTGRA